MKTARILIALLFLAAGLVAGPVKVATFDVDATPPLGSPMAYDVVKRLDEMTLRCRGVVILGSDAPIVLYRVAHALSIAGLDIRSAVVATLGHEVVDVFYVTRSSDANSPSGQVPEGEFSEIRAAVRSALAG